MATHFTQDAVLHFLQSRGGSVRNADLLQHFNDYIREHPDRDRNRELFKKFVNSVASVRQIDGVAHVILRGRFRVGADLPAPPRRSDGSKPGKPADVRSISPAATSDGARQRAGKAAPPAPRGPAGEALPAAGILQPNWTTQVSGAPQQAGGPRPTLRRPATGPEQGVPVTEREAPLPERRVPGLEKGDPGPEKGVALPEMGFLGPGRGAQGPGRGLQGPERDVTGPVGRTPAGQGMVTLASPQIEVPGPGISGPERGLLGSERGMPGPEGKASVGPGRVMQPGPDIEAHAGPERGGREPERRAPAGLGRVTLAGPDRGVLLLERGVLEPEGGALGPGRRVPGPVRGVTGPGGSTPGDQGKVTLAGPQREVPGPDRGISGPERGVLGSERGGASVGPGRVMQPGLDIEGHAGPESGGPEPERRAPAGSGRVTPAGPDRGGLLLERVVPGPERGVLGPGVRTPAGQGRVTPVGPQREVPGTERRISGPKIGVLEAERRVPGPDGGALVSPGRVTQPDPDIEARAGPESGASEPERSAPVGSGGVNLTGSDRGAPMSLERRPPTGPERGALAVAGRGTLVGLGRGGPVGLEMGAPRGPSLSQNISPPQQRSPSGVSAGSGGWHKELGLQTPIQEPGKGSRGHLQQHRGAQQDRSPSQALLPEQGIRRNFKHRKSYKSAVSQDDDDDEEYEYGEEIQTRQGSKGGVGPSRAASTTPPCSADTLAPSSATSSGKGSPQINIHSTEGQMPPSRGAAVWPAGPPARSQEVRTVSPECMPARRSAPLVTDRHIAPAQHHDKVHVTTSPGLDQHQRPSPSLSSNASLSSDTQISSSDRSLHSPSRKSECSSSSSEDLLARPDDRSALVLENFTSRRIGPPAWHSSAGNLCDDHQSMDSLSAHHRSTDHLQKDERFPKQQMPWFFSTGDLCDNPEEAYSSGSSCSPQLRQRPLAVKRTDSKLRSRMCLSLGADLDQVLDMDPTGSEAARLIRLQRISSSLSLHRNLSSSSLSSCPTPPRSSSPAPQVDNEGEKGGRGKASTGQSLCPLEPKEHSWMVKAASGSWGDIYSLFREDPSLLNKRDFISGFTVLHWIAKHGDHRVLNTLWYGVSKVGLSFDINAKSTAGQTPLHIAAIYNSKKVLQLLVTSFYADVRLRDMAGKRPWQYLQNPSAEMLELLGARQWAAERKQQREDAAQPQKQRQNVRHHFSFASPKQRPLTYIGMTKVKRSTSLAAFLKNRSQPFDWHKSESTA